MKDHQRREQEKRDRDAADYESWYARTKGRAFDLRERAVFSDLVGSRAQGDVTVLDLGCGTGRISEAVGSTNRRVVAIDISFESLRQLSTKQIPWVCAVQTVAERLPFRSDLFDAVVACQVLQHLTPEDVDAAVGECARVLKPMGWFGLSVYNERFWRASPQRRQEFTQGRVRDIASRSQMVVERFAYYKALPGRLGRVPGWTAADAAISAIPGIRSRASSYLVAVLVKPA